MTGLRFDSGHLHCSALTGREPLGITEQASHLRPRSLDLWPTQVGTAAIGTQLHPRRPPSGSRRSAPTRCPLSEVPMADASLLQRSLANCAVRASVAGRCGDEVARTQALEEADAIGRLLDVLEQAERAREWDLLAGSPDHG